MLNRRENKREKGGRQLLRRGGGGEKEQKEEEEDASRMKPNQTGWKKRDSRLVSLFTRPVNEWKRIKRQHRTR